VACLSLTASNGITSSRTSLLRSRIPYAQKEKEESSSSGPIIGWVLEKKIPSKKTLEFSIHWCHHGIDEGGGEGDPKPPLQVSLPLNDEDDEEGGGLSSYLWPSGIVGSILFTSPLYRSFFQHKRILELGSGLGLSGMVASAASGNVAKCVLTDRDEYTVRLLNDTILRNTKKHEKSTITPWGKCDLSASIIDWRDFSGGALRDVETASPTRQSFDVVLGTDVAYYHHLIRPLMDVSRYHLKQKSGTSSSDSNDNNNDSDEKNRVDATSESGAGVLCIVGQANRESQWDLYNNIQSGSYNQITDEHEGPWDGSTCLLLYDLAVGLWEEDTASNEEEDKYNGHGTMIKRQQRASSPSLEWNPKKMEEIVPIATLLHSMDGKIHNSLIGPYDKIATKEDEKNQMMSF